MESAAILTSHVGTNASGAEGGDRPVVRVVNESDSYTGALAGVNAEASRIGPGIGPNTVVALPGEAVTVASVNYGFPVHAFLHVPDDQVLVAYIHENPDESRWCGLPLQERSVLIYPPGADHFAIAREGLRLTYAVTESTRLMGVAEDLGLPIEMPRHNQLLEIPPSAPAASLGSAMTQLISAAPNIGLVNLHAEHVLTALAGVLAGDPPLRRRGPARGLDSRKIVKACIAYAEEVGRIPSLRELCLAAYVSERRVRSAFQEEFDCPPTAFFRAWGLERAHRQLRFARPGERSVTEIASALGFFHFGRFAGYYKQLHGEKPSATLHTVG